MITKTDTLLSKNLVDKNVMSEQSLQLFLDEAAKSKESLFALLLKKGALSEEKLLQNLSDVMKVPLVDLASMKPDAVLIEKVPLKIAEYYKMVPLKLDKRKLTIAVSAPLDLRTQDDIRAHLGYEIEMVFARERDVLESIKRFYGFAAGMIGEMMAQQPAPSGPSAAETNFEKIENIEKLAGDASIAQLVNQIILEAYKKRATDIHIEPYRGKVKLRYRIDGILYNANVQTEMSRFILPILSRIKIMSNLNIVERRLPQDGRAIVKVEDTQLDLRVSSIPTPYGESVVIRMLPMNRSFQLAQLGLNAGQLASFENLINKPHGVIFITGPTGSGKSTTLYACLQKINTDERKIITIEDPVEYEMEGVTQIQVVAPIGLDFAKGLRSMLRHDPDVMMVGEVRDLETAEIAIRVALTGHLVFSTLHTNDAASGITRLIDIGVEPYLIASSVESFIAQRLVRTLCPHCKEEDPTVTADMKRQIAAELGDLSTPVKVYRGKGCGQCNDTGFWGRLAIYEILLITESIQELIMKRATAGDIKRRAVTEGMRTLRQDGWQKVIAGLSTPEEILEATQNDGEMIGARIEEVSPELETPKKSKFKLALKNSGLRSESNRDHGRFFVRLTQAVNVHYKLVKTPDAKDPLVAREGTAVPVEYSFTTNISAGGLVFIATDKLIVGSILELIIELPDHGEDIGCLARIVREEELSEKRIYEMAVCFLDLSAPLRARLENFVIKETK